LTHDSGYLGSDSERRAPFENDGGSRNWNHEGHEEHEGKVMNWEPIDERDESFAHRVIGAAIEVHRRLGPGFLETIYEADLIP
jgi:hypothetical protein